MKISIISAIWKREQLSRIFLNSVKRYWKDYGITTMIAGSEGVKSREMVLDYGADYVEAPNSPLSAKFNKALISAQANYSPDGFLILGSDDFINDALIEKYFNLLEQGVDVVGFTDCYFYQAESKEAAYWRGYQDFRKGMTIGMARMLSQKTFRTLKGKLWPSNMDSGLDYNMTKKLKRARGLKWASLSAKDSPYVLVDIKTKDSMSEFGCYRKDMTPVDTWCFRSIPEFSEIEKL